MLGLKFQWPPQSTVYKRVIVKKTQLVIVNFDASIGIGTDTHKHITVDGTVEWWHQAYQAALASRQMLPIGNWLVAPNAVHCIRQVEITETRTVN